MRHVAALHRTGRVQTQGTGQGESATLKDVLISARDSSAAHSAARRTAKLIGFHAAIPPAALYFDYICFCCSVLLFDA